MFRTGLVALAGASAAGYMMGLTDGRGYKRRMAFLQSKVVEEDLRSLQPVVGRDEMVRRLKDAPEALDVLVVGGGASGAGVALDAATRGLKVALVERDDLASGTSSRSTKLIHGGVRYLQKAVFDMDPKQLSVVTEALRERAHLLCVAPHLSDELAIALPIYQWWRVPYYWSGLVLYDLLAGGLGLNRTYYLSKASTLQRFPMLHQNGLVGSLVYFDGQHDDARMCLSIALTAAAHGATIANHVSVVELLTEPTSGAEGESRIVGAVVEDLQTGERFPVRAKVVVNATGAYVDALRSQSEPEAKALVAPSDGVHLTLPPHFVAPDMGLLTESSDGRVIFVLPWQGHAVAGTTDNPATLVEEPSAARRDVDFIVQSLHELLDVPLDRARDVQSAWAGYRPLVRDPASESTQAIARTHVVLEDSKGLVTLTGGKWTTYRHMAEEAVDHVVGMLRQRGEPTYRLQPCSTTQRMLLGGHGWHPQLYVKLAQTMGVSMETAKHLCAAYGDRAADVLRLAAAHGRGEEKLVKGFPYLLAEVDYAVEREWAVSIADVLARRTRLAFLDCDAARLAVPRVADIMAEHLKWSGDKKRREVEKALLYLQTMAPPS